MSIQQQFLKKSTQGTVLIVALIFGSIMVTVLAGYLAIAKQSMTFSHRTFNTSAVFNLAEASIESGLRAINTNDWSGWESGSNYKRIQLSAYYKLHDSSFNASYVDIDTARNVRGDATILVYNPNTNNTYLVTKAALWTGANTSTNLATKYVRLDLKRRALFATGLLSKNGITFNGNNTVVDAFDSAVGAYGGSNVLDKGKIASLDIEVSTIGVKNANIYGHAAVGGSDARAGISVGPQGLVGPFGTPNNTLVDSHISADFRAELPEIVVPNSFGGATIPAGNNPVIIGSNDPANPKIFSANDLSYSGNTHGMTIQGHVIIVAQSLRLTGNNSYLNVTAGSTAQLYIDGGIAIRGNGIGNPNVDPASLAIYQTEGSWAAGVEIKGNGTLRAVVYAPNSTIVITGNGEAYGAIIGEQIFVTGNANFHYDINLEKKTDGQPYTLFRWLELNTAADQSPYATAFTETL